MQNFTQEDLLQYLYNESSPEKSSLLKAALDTDWSLREQYEVISSAITGLEKLTLSPRQIAVENILNYAEKSLTALSTEV